MSKQVSCTITRHNPNRQQSIVLNETFQLAQRKVFNEIPQEEGKNDTRDV